MRTQDISFGRIYTPNVPMEEEVYCYVRGWRDGQVGISVLDEATDTPDFSNCGVFWLNPEHFAWFHKIVR